MKKILVLEDEASIRSFIVINLRRAGYDVIEAESGEEALERLRANPDVKVALLDIMLPGIDGFEVCRRIRATNTKIGIIMLTARSQEMDKVTGLMTRCGRLCDQALLPGRVDSPGGCPVPPGRRRGDGSDRRNQPAALPAEHPEPDIGEKWPEGEADTGGVCHYAGVYGKPRQGSVPGGIWHRVWGRDYFGELKIVDVNIRRLRLKIEDNVQNPTFITTVWGYGYKWGA